jgi:hypothetical protein
VKGLIGIGISINLSLTQGWFPTYPISEIFTFYFHGSMMLHISFEDGHSLKEQLDVLVHRSSNDVFAAVQPVIHRVAKRCLTWPYVKQLDQIIMFRARGKPPQFSFLVYFFPYRTMHQMEKRKSAGFWQGMRISISELHIGLIFMVFYTRHCQKKCSCGVVCTFASALLKTKPRLKLRLKFFKLKRLLR